MKKTTLAFCLYILSFQASSNAIETTEVDLRFDQPDGKVAITRDEAGNLLFDDAFTLPITLQDLLQNAADHGALEGLSGDDHPQYLNAARHQSAHQPAFNTALPISGDVNANQTLGAHVSDGDIHPDTTAAASITGVWNFTNGLAITSGNILLGTSQYGPDAALRFEAGVEDAELVYTNANGQFTFNRPVGVPEIAIETTLYGSGTAALAGFASIEGIAPADMLSSTETESISETWTFLSGANIMNRLEAATWVQPSPAVTKAVVRNASSAINAGDVLVWKGVTAGMLDVATLASAMDATRAFAGVALEGAAPGSTLEIARSGVAAIAVAESFSSGDVVGWNGSGARPINTSDTAGIGYALEDGTSGGTALIMVERVEGGF